MAADGFVRPPVTHDDGIYLGLPLQDYLDDRALSGSTFKRLLSDPAGLYWESEANPLWIKPEKASNRPRLRGSACHCAILEGFDAYAQRYVVKPEGVLVTQEDLKDFLRESRKLLEVRLGATLGREEAKPYVMTGSRDDLVKRVLALDPKARVWDAMADGREVLHAEDDEYVRLIERFVRNDPTFAPLVTGGVPEITIFWTENGQRFKARLDYVNPHTVLDLKTFGQAPRRGRSLRQHCIAEATYNCYDLQAVHNFHAVEVATERLLDQCAEFHLNGNAREFPMARLVEIEALFAQLAAHPPVFRWLFIRMGGAPTGISIPFRQSDGQWSEARRQIEDACALYRQFHDAFGDSAWLVTHGEQEISDTDWPLAAIRGAE